MGARRAVCAVTVVCLFRLTRDFEGHIDMVLARLARFFTAAASLLDPAGVSPLQLRVFVYV
jgi:hypothetical protein